MRSYLFVRNSVLPKALLLLAIAYLSSVKTYAANIDLDSVLRIGLPVVVVQTENNEMPVADVAVTPEGCIGNSIVNATKVSGRVLVISVNGDTIFDSGDYVKKESGMTIKLRGNTSAAFAQKKPYKIKLQKKGDMLGRGKKFADKDWALLRNDWDCLSTLVSLKVCKMLGEDWTPSMKYVNVVFNGEYKGLYMLSETVERNTDCRINVSKTGYVIESDPYWWNEERSFDGIIDLDGWEAKHWYEFTFKYPDVEDLTDEQYEYIKQAVVDMEQSILDGTYDSQIDLNSFAVWLLIHDILGTNDSAGSNRFLSRYDNTSSSLFKMSTPWDFDTSFLGDSTKWANIHNEFYYKYLFTSGNKAFAKAYVDKWNEIKSTFFDDIHDYLMEYKASDEAKAVQKSWIADDSIYHEGGNMQTGKTVDENIAFIDNWLARRKTTIDALVVTIDTTTVINGITDINVSPKEKTNMKAYNLLGQEVLPNTKGIVIINGRKRINR